ncbi:uncharacterized protein LOC132720194 [Ruditapes philippinarum]|uniref:uncharacterized protein LOC132720194 n=1 Tax=Ruditapes philippinarum TaxID=129788 RepID=UPI00295BFC1B|nr:uncharacterized protein LOC132720194 [Ruditapes philippinarum]
MAAISGSEMDKQSDELLHLLCSPCKRKQRNKEADKYCADCHDYYCSDCVKFHEDIPALSGHKILDKDQVKDGISGIFPEIPTQSCERHGFKAVDMYCQSHDNVGCSICMAVDHKSCNDVFYVPEYVLDHDPTSKCEDVQRKLVAVTRDIEFQLKIRQREIKRLCQGKEEEVEKIKQFRIDINQKLVNLEKKSIDKIEDKYKTLIKKFEEQITILTTFQTDVQISAADIKYTLSNVSQKFVGMKVANAVTERAGNCLNEKTVEFKRFDVVFEGQQRLMSMIDQMDMLGVIEEKPALYRLLEKREISIKHDSDKSLYNDINSICMLKDGCVIIADNVNKSLKRLDLTLSKIIDVCQRLRSPWQVCEIDNEIAVSSEEMNIDILTTEGPLKVTRQIKTDHECYGLGYKNGKIYVTDSMETIFVYNKTGTMLIQFSKDQSGDNLFSDIYSLTVSQDGKRIYVANGTYGLVVLSKEGKLHGKYNPSNLRLAREICETNSGDILVCGESSNNIVQFSSNVEVLGEILTSDSTEGGCLAVCFDRSHTKLIVGRSERNYIEVYDMN